MVSSIKSGAARVRKSREAVRLENFVGMKWSGNGRRRFNSENYVAFNSENYVRCSNVRQSLANGRPICTRVICRDCHDDYGWDFHAAMADPHWTCTHCRDVCPKCAPAEDPYVLEAGHDTELGRVYGQQPGMRGQLANAQRQHAFWALLKEINRAKVEGELADAAAAAPAPPPRAPPPDQSWADWAMDQVGSMPITVRGATSGEDFTVAEGLGAVASVVTGGLSGDSGGGRNLSDRLSDLMVQQQVGRTPRQHGGTSARAHRRRRSSRRRVGTRRRRRPSSARRRRCPPDRRRTIRRGRSRRACWSRRRWREWRSPWMRRLTSGLRAGGVPTRLATRGRTRARRR